MLSAPPDTGRMAKKRNTDRHSSGFMLRFPEEFREQLRELQAQHYAQHRYKPPLTFFAQTALEEFLVKHNLWPPRTKE